MLVFSSPIFFSYSQLSIVRMFVLKRVANAKYNIRVYTASSSLGGDWAQKGCCIGTLYHLVSTLRKLLVFKMIKITACMHACRYECTPWKFNTLKLVTGKDTSLAEIWQFWVSMVLHVRGVWILNIHMYDVCDMCVYHSTNIYIYICLEPKWPLFWLEKTLFWGVDLQK